MKKILYIIIFIICISVSVLGLIIKISEKRIVVQLIFLIAIEIYFLFSAIFDKEF